MTKLFWRDTGLPAGLDINEGVVLYSHCRGASVSKIHAHLQTFQVYLIVLDSGLAEYVFGLCKTQ